MKTPETYTMKAAEIKVFRCGLGTLQAVDDIPNSFNVSKRFSCFEGIETGDTFEQPRYAHHDEKLDQ